MTEQEKQTTVVFTTDCVERCGVLPNLRYDEQQGVEAYIPGGNGSHSHPGAWVHVHISQEDGIVTLVCDPTPDGFQAIYHASIERYQEAWHPETRHCSRAADVPRRCGPCADRMDNIIFKTRTFEDRFYIDTNSRTYQFRQDDRLRDEPITPEMVKLVVNYMNNHGIEKALEKSFFEMLGFAFQETMGL